LTEALQQRDAASQKFLRLHQQVAFAAVPFLLFQRTPTVLTTRWYQVLELKAEAASLETESNALRQQNRRLAARIMQLQVARTRRLTVMFSYLTVSSATVSRLRTQRARGTCPKRRSGCSREWSRCRSSAGAPAAVDAVLLPSCEITALSHAFGSILHSVVINLVIESGVNWNRDERLFALFMMDPKVCVSRCSSRRCLLSSIIHS
jgi:hypothetical protein